MAAPSFRTAQSRSSAARRVNRPLESSFRRASLTPRGVRLAIRKLLSGERYTRRAGELRDWAASHDGAATAAAEVEALAASRVYAPGG